MTTWLKHCKQFKHCVTVWTLNKKKHFIWIKSSMLFTQRNVMMIHLIYFNFGLQKYWKIWVNHHLTQLTPCFLSEWDLTKNLLGSWCPDICMHCIYDSLFIFYFGKYNLHPNRANYYQHLCEILWRWLFCWFDERIQMPSCQTKLPMPKLFEYIENNGFELKPTSYTIWLLIPFQSRCTSKL